MLGIVGKDFHHLLINPNRRKDWRLGRGSEIGVVWKIIFRAYKY